MPRCGADVASQVHVMPGMKVREVMRSTPSNPADAISADADVAEAAARMIEHHTGCLPVVEGGALIGCVTSTDLLRNTRGAPTIVDAVMSRTVLAVTPATDLLEAAALMRNRGVRHLPVVDPARRVIGILSDRDVRSSIGDPDEPDARAAGLKVAHAMTHDVYTVIEGTSLAEVAERLVDRSVGAVPVVDAGGRLIGMVSYSDLLIRH